MLLNFNPETHIYTAEDGEILPSVTALVSPLDDAFDEEKMDMPQIINATERGITMHAYMAWRLQDGDSDYFELPSDYEPYADAVELFLAEHRPSPLLIETPMSATYHGVSFAGTPDLITNTAEIYDWKFVSQISKSKVGAQLNGYGILASAQTGAEYRLFAVQFLPDGTYRRYPVAARAEPFKLCLDLYAEKRRKHPKGEIA